LTTPIIRQMEIERLTKANIYQNCLNCLNWKHKEDICGKYNIKPPTKIIVNSCPDYVDEMEIPF
jgi:hypothetical protein